MESKLVIFFTNWGDSVFKSSEWKWVFHHHAIELISKDGKEQMVVPEYHVLFYKVIMSEGEDKE